MKLPNQQQIEAHRAVCSRGESMASVAKAYGVSKSTIQKWLDVVTEFNCADINLHLKGEEFLEVIGWLKNGNHYAGMIATAAEKQVKNQ